MVQYWWLRTDVVHGHFPNYSLSSPLSKYLKPFLAWRLISLSSHTFSSLPSTGGRELICPLAPKRRRIAVMTAHCEPKFHAFPTHPGSRLHAKLWLSYTRSCHVSTGSNLSKGRVWRWIMNENMEETQSSSCILYSGSGMQKCELCACLKYKVSTEDTREKR